MALTLTLTSTHKGLWPRCEGGRRRSTLDLQRWDEVAWHTAYSLADLTLLVTTIHITDTQRFVDDIVESLGKSRSPSHEAEERREAQEDEDTRRPLVRGCRRDARDASASCGDCVVVGRARDTETRDVGVILVAGALENAASSKGLAVCWVPMRHSSAFVSGTDDNNERAGSHQTHTP